MGADPVTGPILTGPGGCGTDFEIITGNGAVLVLSFTGHGRVRV